MAAMASQATSVSIVYLTVCSGVEQRKHQNSVPLAFVGGNSPVNREFPGQRANNAEKYSIWWCHHVKMFPGLSFRNIPNKPGALLKEPYVFQFYEETNLYEFLVSTIL